MPVTPKNVVTWPNHVVPYEISETNLTEERTKVIHDAVQELNARVGNAIFVAKTNQTGWAMFQWGESGSSDIGYVEARAREGQKIHLSTKWTEVERVKQTIHEMCHCLGFEHEWFASQYPLAACGPTSFAWDMRGTKMLEKQRTGVTTILPLDANSVMMYNEWRNRMPPVTRARFASVMSGDYLSSRDISAIKFLYA